ncbi:MAG: molecular chaperone TorD family protein [Sulfurospirillum sp.]|nr:molecular chaperone TorD family protein [Sulfurospirillum sp.]MBP9612397.1 molecular chaperone TorD family protein [Sulfurospirillum sp.]
MMNKEAINKARAVYYGLFASLLTFFDNPNDLKAIEKTIDLLAKNPLDEESSFALSNMQNLLITHGYAFLKEESDNVFFNPYSAYIPVTASFYLESRDDGQKRLEMVNYVLSSKFRRDTTKFKELEDHIGFIVLFLQKLIEEEIAGDTKSALLAREVFENILNPFVDMFIEALYAHESSIFYQECAVVMRSFIALERLYLQVQKPLQEEETPKTFVKEVKKVRKPITPRPKKNMDEFVL